MQANSSHGAVESRAAARTNLFLAATMHSADTQHPVKIRDLSATGARIETSLVSEVGDAVTLVRGRLSVHARVTRSGARFCGLSFNSPVSIQAWMTNPVLLERQRGRPRVAVEGEVATLVHSEAEMAGSVAEELSRVSRWLGIFGQTLANDPEVVTKHGTQLYDLGLAARALAAFAESMQADVAETAANTA